MTFKDNDIIFLLGAGCSFEADIPIANKMVEYIESDFLVNNEDWKKHKDLYNYVKSAILYADGIFGSFNNAFNIEKFVNILTELEKKEKNVVYPFIANWNNRLLDLAGKDFINLKALKKLITAQLIEWIKVDDYHKRAGYYSKFYDFQKEAESSLRVFTLNYDLCFENLKPTDAVIELGFDESRTWNSFRFEDPNINPQIYLYKLHGSITWKRDKSRGNILKLSEHPEREPDLVFGTETKLQSIDPYLFHVYAFRKHSLDSRLIIIIGYSFNDSYINDLLKQALENHKNRKLICVSPYDVSYNLQAEIMQKLGHNIQTQVVVVNAKASEFLQNQLNVKNLSTYVAEDIDDVF